MVESEQSHGEATSGTATSRKPPTIPTPSVSSLSTEDKHYNDLEGWLSKLAVGTPLAESEVKLYNGRYHGAGTLDVMNYDAIYTAFTLKIMLLDSIRN